MSQLHMYNNGEDIVIAENPEEATKIACEQCGYKSIEEYKDDFYEYLDWKQLDPNSHKTIIEEDDNTKITKTVAEWIAESGKCYFAGNNW